MCPACITTDSRQPCPLPCLPALFTVVASQCSAIQYQSESCCNLLYYSPVLIEQVIQPPKLPPPLPMDSVLPGPSHKEQFLPHGQLIPQMLVHCLTIATPQTTTKRTQFYQPVTASTRDKKSDGVVRLSDMQPQCCRRVSSWGNKKMPRPKLHVNHRVYSPHFQYSRTGSTETSQQSLRKLHLQPGSTLLAGAGRHSPVAAASLLPDVTVGI